MAISDDINLYPENILSSKCEKVELDLNQINLSFVKIINQIDKKFLVGTFSDFLILFDQHAVHERIRLENMVKDYLYSNLYKKNIFY